MWFRMTILVYSFSIHTYHSKFYTMPVNDVLQNQLHFRSHSLAELSVAPVATELTILLRFLPSLPLKWL